MPDIKRLERFVEMQSMIDRGEAVTPKSLAEAFRCGGAHDLQGYRSPCNRPHYTISPDFSMDKHFEAGWHILRYGEPVEVRLRFSKEAARWITRRKWHPTQKIEKNKDGSIIFSVTLNGTKERRWWGCVK